VQLSQQHCLNHFNREAAARCPECRQFYCRECITEHDDRVICAACLKKLSQTKTTKRDKLTWIGRLGACCVGVTFAWLFFYWTGQILLSIPTSFHEGTVWKTGFWNEE
jgi:hypothetical protein